MATATTNKACVHCHKDLTHDRRMRDSQGHYWCVACGREDTKLKKLNSKHCVDCRGKYLVDEMKQIDGLYICKGCMASREKERGNLMHQPVSEETEVLEKARSKKMQYAVAIGVIAIGMALISLSVLGYW
jgi:DNA-directed RNA polymerase subunit RPC12/RpoP